MTRVPSRVAAVVAQSAGRARQPWVTSASASLLQRGLRLIRWGTQGEKSSSSLYPGIQGGNRVFSSCPQRTELAHVHGLYAVPENLQQRKEKLQKAYGSPNCSIQITANACGGFAATLGFQAGAVFCDHLWWPPHTTDQFLMAVGPFSLKLQIINVSQHLQEIKACSPASCCWSGRLGYQASNINIAAVLGADVSRGLHEQNYNCGDYRGHLWDSLGNTSGPAIRCVSPYRGSISRAAGSGDLHPGAISQGRAELSKQTQGGSSPRGHMQYQGHLSWELLVSLKLMPKFPLASRRASFITQSSLLLRELAQEWWGPWVLAAPRRWGDKLSASLLLPCKAPKENLFLPRPGVTGAMVTGDRREINSTAHGSRCCFTTSLYMYVLLLLLVTGQQQNQRGLCRVAFRETAKGAAKLRMEKPSKISAQDKSPIKNYCLGKAEAGMPKADCLKRGRDPARCANALAFWQRAAGAGTREVGL